MTIFYIFLGLLVLIIAISIVIEVHLTLRNPKCPYCLHHNTEIKNEYSYSDTHFCKCLDCNRHFNIKKRKN